MARRAIRGQALVEFALELPLFVLMLLAIFDFGRVIWARNSLENAAREGTRQAIVHGDSVGQSCPWGPSGGLYATTPAASSACPFPAPSKQSIYNTVRSFTVAGGQRPATCASADTTTTGPCVAACYGASCSGDTNAVSTTIRGTSVTVTITSQLGLIVPRLIGVSTFTISVSSTMLVNT